MAVKRICAAFLSAYFFFSSLLSHSTSWPGFSFTHCGTWDCLGVWIGARVSTAEACGGGIWSSRKPARAQPGEEGFAMQSGTMAATDAWLGGAPDEGGQEYGRASRSSDSSSSSYGMGPASALFIATSTRPFLSLVFFFFIWFTYPTYSFFSKGASSRRRPAPFETCLAAIPCSACLRPSPIRRRRRARREAAVREKTPLPCLTAKEKAMLNVADFCAGCAFETSFV